MDERKGIQSVETAVADPAKPAVTRPEKDGYKLTDVMIVVSDDVAVLPMSKKDDNLSSLPSSSHAAGESTTATPRKNSSTWDSQHDLAGKGVLKRSPCHTRPVYGVATHHGMMLSYHRGTLDAFQVLQ